MLLLYQKAAVSNTKTKAYGFIPTKFYLCTLNSEFHMTFLFFELFNNLKLFLVQGHIKQSWLDWDGWARHYWLLHCTVAESGGQWASPLWRWKDASLLIHVQPLHLGEQARLTTAPITYILLTKTRINFSLFRLV